MPVRLKVYRRRVKILRALFIVSLLAVVMALVTLPLFFSGTPKLGRLNRGQALEESDNTVQQAIYRARTQKETPFQLFAEKAQNTPSGQAALSNPKAHLKDKVAGGVGVSAPRGFYDPDSNFLTLEGGVTLQTDSGYVLDTPDADIDLTQEAVRGTHGVSGQGPMGTVQGEAFDVHGDALALKGRSRLVINCP
jgi:lipopolysaccharide export system protein LptC